MSIMKWFVEVVPFMDIIMECFKDYKMIWIGIFTTFTVYYATKIYKGRSRSEPGELQANDSPSPKRRFNLRIWDYSFHFEIKKLSKFSDEDDEKEYILTDEYILKGIDEHVSATGHFGSKSFRPQVYSAPSFFGPKTLRPRVVSKSYGADCPQECFVESANSQRGLEEAKAEQYSTQCLDEVNKEIHGVTDTTSYTFHLDHAGNSQNPQSTPADCKHRMGLALLGPKRPRGETTCGRNVLGPNKPGPKMAMPEMAGSKRPGPNCPKPKTMAPSCLMRWKLSKSPRGLCIIINMKAFKHDPFGKWTKGSWYRHGSEKDVDNLFTTFDELYFKVQLHENPTMKMSIMKWFVEVVPFMDIIMECFKDYKMIWIAIFTTFTVYYAIKIYKGRSRSEPGELQANDSPSPRRRFNLRIRDYSFHFKIKKLSKFSDEDDEKEYILTDEYILKGIDEQAEQYSTQCLDEVNKEIHGVTDTTGYTYHL
ncbi:unnamed protein product, partial [Cyprideis torosa]